MSAAKKLTLPALQRMEARALDYIGQVEQARSAEELEDARLMVGYVVEVMVESGYNPVAAEGFLARARKVSAETLMRAQWAAPAQSPPGANAAGLDVLYFRSRLKAALEILRTYTPSEFARECGRWARRADPRVLAEDEFQ
jgi:hypothetical protein